MVARDIPVEFKRARSLVKGQKILQESARAVWHKKWSCLLACAASKAVASSLVNRRGCPGAGGDVPSMHKVIGEDKHV